MTNPYFSSYSALARNTLVRAEAVNAIIDAIIVGFDRVPVATTLLTDSITFCTDTGAANAYAIAPTNAIASYVAGQRFSFVAVNANTAASTINVSALGVKTIKRQSGADLSANDILAGAIVIVEYDGTNFQLITSSGSDADASAASAAAAAISQTAAATSATSASTSAAQAAASATTAGATVSQWAAAGGTADAITATFPTTVTNLTDGLILGFRASAANATTTPTFKADGTTARTITKLGGAALGAGDIYGAGHEVLLRYKLANTRWELLNPAVAAPTVLLSTFAGVALAASYAQITSLSLTPGKWRITAYANIVAAVSATYFKIAISTTTASNTGTTSGVSEVSGAISATPIGACVIPGMDVTVSSTTTYYMNMLGNGTGAGALDGHFRAERIA